MDILQQMFKCGGTRKYIFSDDMRGVFPSNTTCSSFRDSLILNMRCLDYYYPTQFGEFEKTISNNRIGVMDNVEFKSSQSPTVVGEYPHCGMYYGREDVRLVVWGEELYGYCVRPDAIPGEVVIEVLKYDTQLIPHHLYYAPNLQQVEKNWMAIEGKPHSFIYNIFDGLVVEIDGVGDPTWHRNAIPKATGSGSTNLIRYKDHYIGIVHRHEPWPNYEHSFVIYDKGFTSVKQTDWFKFSKYPVEFTTGMCIHNDKLIITLSELDSIPVLLQFNISALDVLLGEDPIESDPESYWAPQYIGDPYQNLSYQLFLGNIGNYLQELKNLNLFNSESINKLHNYGIFN